MFCGVIAMFSGPFQFSARLRKHSPQLHRTLGKIYVISVAIGALLATYIDLTVDVHASWMVNIGFLSHPFAWGLTAVIAYRTAVTRNFNVHRQWMIRSYLITFTFVLVRLPMPIRTWREMSETSFSIVTPVLMFLCYFGADVALNWREISTKRAA
jgi:uncharacterized membrane protein